MNKITLTVGISNSGKTTWAKEQNAVNINRDDLRLVHYCPSENLQDYKFSKAKENNITEMQYIIAERAIRHGHDVIVSDTNLNSKTRANWEQYAKVLAVELKYKEFDIEPHIAKKRNIKRDYSVPESVIDQQYAAWRKIKNLPKYTGTPGKPKAVIFDVDGTLADMTGVRRPFEWDKVGLDAPRPSVINLARMYDRAGYKIIVMSGRDGICYADTLHWLHDKLPIHKLFMRAQGDSRCDAVIKEELFWACVANDFDIELVVDDRDQMVSRWRAMGLECWQVQAGNF